MVQFYVASISSRVNCICQHFRSLSFYACSTFVGGLSFVPLPNTDKMERRLPTAEAANYGKIVDNQLWSGGESLQRRASAMSAVSSRGTAAA